MLQSCSKIKMEEKQIPDQKMPILLQKIPKSNKLNNLISEHNIYSRLFSENYSTM